MVCRMRRAEVFGDIGTECWSVHLPNGYAGVSVNAARISPRPTICELSGLYESGEVVDETLCRIERLDPALNSFVTVTDKHAVEQAGKAEAEIRAGRKRGIPYNAKDLLNTKGIPTT